MTSLGSEIAISSASPFEQFARAVNQSVPSGSRRDFVRAGALLAAAAGMSGVSGRQAAARWVPSTHLAAQTGVETGVEIVVPFDPYGQPVSLDPHRAPNWGPFWILFPHVWAGLLAFDENGAVVPDLAESVEPNEAADVWTATLKPDLTFASGNPVTAQSFVDSWLRALDPQMLSPMASFMSLVEGYEAYVSGDSNEIGFAVADDRTIEITLSAPFSSFPASLATFVWAVIDLAVIDDPELDDPLLSGAGAGIWQFTEFVDGDRIVMEPNPDSVIPASPSISRVTWQVVEGPDAASQALDLYGSDLAVSADVPSSLLPSVEDDDALSAELVAIESQASTMAIGMDFNQAPFNDIRVRQAIAASVDRDAWANEIWAGEFVPATGMVPPVVAITSGYQGATPPDFDPELAASLLEEAGLDPDANMPDIVYYQPADDNPSHIEHHAALLEMISGNSGLVIRHDTSLTADQVIALQVDNGGRQFDVVWYWTISDTASLLETVGASTSPFMAGWFNWSSDLVGIEEQDPAAASSEFDTHIAAANGSTDPAARNDAFLQAEQLLLENAVYVPLGHWVQRYVQKPWLQGTRQGPWSGRIPVRFDQDVVVQGRSAG
jgi:ABC-type transport system substrate-binding protein